MHILLQLWHGRYVMAATSELFLYSTAPISEGHDLQLICVWEVSIPIKCNLNISQIILANFLIRFELLFLPLVPLLP